ncbi:hypothetical protein [Treponema pectinovorum]|uniref:hypothetical protein n=1 Tax=Treponema pectinovorum TaxID=164 RepID=UPI0011F0A99A|nr:hypothetical protein [Treponema pectinovorum]
MKNHKKISKIFFLIPVFFFQNFLFARGNQELIPAGHWIYDSTQAVFMESSLVNFSDSAPLTIQELKTYLDEVDEENLSESGKKELKKIFDYFQFEPIGLHSDLMQLGFEPSLNLSAFYKSNEEIDWIYDRYFRKPFIYAPLSISCADIFTMKMDLLLGMNKNTTILHDTRTNLMLSADQIDINFPDEGYFSTGYKFTNRTGIGFQIGKGSRSIGKTLAGSMIWSRYLTGVSYAQMQAYSPNLKYTAVVSQLNVDKYMYTHLLEARFFQKFTFSVLEGMLVNAPLELRFLNPLTVFHGMAPWREYDRSSYDSESHTSAYLGIKVQYIPVKNLKLYGLYAMTQFQTNFETSNYPDDTTPNGRGGQLGGIYSLPYKNGRFTFSFEGSYAEPYLYIKESPNWSLVKTYAENMGSKRYPFYEWVGSPFGPDTISFEAKVGYEIPQKWVVDLLYLFMARGEMSGTNVFTSMKTSSGSYAWGGLYTGNDYPTDWCYPDSDRMSKAEAKRRQSLVTPTGIPEFVNRISVKASYAFNPHFDCTFQPSYVLIFNHAHKSAVVKSAFEFALACSIKY